MNPCSVPYLRQRAEMSLHTRRAAQPNIPPVSKEIRVILPAESWLQVVKMGCFTIPGVKGQLLGIILFGMIVCNILEAMENIHIGTNTFSSVSHWDALFR